MKSILFRTATIPVSLNVLLKGQLQFLNEYYDVTAISGKDEFLVELKEREKVRVFGIEMQRQIAPIKDLKSLWRLYRYFKKQKPLIVHSITPKAGLLTMIAGKMAGVPIRIHTFTGLIFPSRKGFMQVLLINMDKLLCYCATDVYPEGKGVRNDLINYKITNKPLEVIGNGNVNGIDENYFDPKLYNLDEKNELRKKLGIFEDDFVFIFVGRLVRDKGINELIVAFLRFQSVRKNVKLLLVGPFENDLDPLNIETIKVIKECNTIITVGFQQDVRPYFAISDVLVFPSHREGFPNVVLQAGAMGLPCIVTNINGSNEIIIEEENGIIIPVKDEIAIFNAMTKISTDKDYYSVLETNARSMITSRYEQKIVWNAILAQYKSLEKKCIKLF
ncbi:glycosyltransferase family 4 protein [Flavobacterium saccharophilum]|uniref:Glycosyltransferase involved in cell wall bisynthesis n=1 Tax=Flavobacterium saccharophilum TaxID=29534 RepID=A0A1M7KAC6_9FLAO|nr:glycosyltransferase family 4 protein [Flavobacterium saccharophilum]SHM61923.1 Glycosyltransferase involved in cell wall bisynthesis [Flavobacterium saccharophilum]